MCRVLSIGVLMSLVATAAISLPVDSGQPKRYVAAEAAVQEGDSASQEGDSAAAPAEAFAVIDAQLKAFNDHDVEAMVANLAEDFAWFAVDPDMTRVELRGRDEFRRSMMPYFASVPGARAEIEERVIVGRFAAVRERAFWLQGGDEVSQASLAVYEIRDRRIRRVWYYPVEQ